MCNIFMSSQAFKHEEKKRVSEFAAAQQLAPDTLKPKISRASKMAGLQDERILTPKDAQFVQTLALIKGVCNDFTRKEVV
ncbi:Uncharacterised protein [uncultured archaeon]|nr:Uncharacterised protein [uncultured archaeon]